MIDFILSFWWIFPVMLVSAIFLAITKHNGWGHVGAIMSWLFIELKSLFLSLQIRVFGEPPNTQPTYFVPINAEIVNPVRNGFKYIHCPQQIACVRKSDGRLWVDFGNFVDEPVRWYTFPCVTFMVGRSSGIVKKAAINYRMIHSKGKYFCHTCENPEWAKYMSSVIQAHLEVLKFSMSRRSRYPALASRIFKYHGEQIFQGI